MSFNQWMDKPIMVYSCNGISSSNGNEWTVHTCNNMGEPQNNFVEWKEPDTKEHLLYDSIYIKLENANYLIVTESRSVVAQEWEKQKETGKKDYKGTRVHFESNRDVYCLDFGHGFMSNLIRLYSLNISRLLYVRYTSKDLFFFLKKIHLKISTKKTNNSIKVAKLLNRHFTKGDREMASKHIKHHVQRD